MNRYYNDVDAKACEWLRELIAAGHLPPGDVDCRSILEVKADELKGYGQCHFFAGIGGWALAMRWAGIEDVEGIWTGSCPCQPLSCAGKRKGHADERHLWPAFYALIAERRPATVFGEQVASKDGREWFAGVRLDLEGLGYACGGADLCAAGVGAPHRRQRLFWVADANGRHEGDGGLQRGREHGQRAAHGGVVRMADVQRERLEGLGGHGDGRREPGRFDTEAAGHAAESGTTGRMADAEHDGGRADEPGREAQGRAADGRACGMGNATGGGCGVGGDAALAGRSGHADRAGWSRYDIIPCRDGKARRVEAGTFPLADGVPGRMGLLRGYGNAIVPELAQVFIEAWNESEGE